jgi:hypothetical protein
MSVLETSGAAFRDVAILLAVSALFASCKEETKEGGEGQPCYPNETCDEGLVCVDGLCRAESADGRSDADAPDLAAEEYYDGPCRNDPDCSNGLACDGSERCIDGACLPGEIPACDDGDPCTVDFCEEEASGCTSVPIDEDGDGYFAMEGPGGELCPGTDCDEEDRDVHPDAAPDCTGGRDMDCDTVPDMEEDFVIVDAETRLTDEVDSSSRPFLVWTGTEYGVAWSDLRDGNYEIYFARVSHDGEKLSGDERLTDDISDSNLSSLAWTGSEFAVAWFDGGSMSIVSRIWFARVQADGIPAGTPTLVVDDGSAKAGATSLAWTGTEFGMAFHTNVSVRNDVYFLRLTPEGVPIGTRMDLTEGAGEGSYDPSLVWTGSEFAVVWWRVEVDRTNNELYFQRLLPDGLPTGPLSRITDDPGKSTLPALAWTGEDFLLAWKDDRDGNLEIYTARLSAEGVMPGGNIRITETSFRSVNPALACGDLGPALAWLEAGEGAFEAVLQQLTAEGLPAGERRVVSESAWDEAHLSLAWDGGAFGIAWDDARHGDTEIYFTKIGCE